MNLDRTSLVYTACYCEENIWKLCDYIRVNHPSYLPSCWVVFISNRAKCISVWKQQKCEQEDSPVLWDYHVILLCQVDGEAVVFDFDTTLPFPCPCSQYLQEALRPGYISLDARENILKYLRLIKASEFLERFSSDRSHMWNAKSRKWNSPPPAYPCIITEFSPCNIQSFIGMGGFLECYGTVMSLNEFDFVTDHGRRLHSLSRFAWEKENGVGPQEVHGGGFVSLSFFPNS